MLHEGNGEACKGRGRPVTVKEAAKRLEISPSLVYLLISQGRLACVRHGLGRGVIRISEEQLHAYLAEAEGRPAPARPLPSATGNFRHLDAEKLRQAWKRHA